MKLKQFTYTKENGDVSNRLAFIVAEPRDNYLVYDVSKFSSDEVTALETAIQKSNELREDCFSQFELLTGKKVNTLWRSFKSEGISWRD